ncbi:MAG: VCBS repeat-containing protein, partial [Myxococcales bacterium]|nr:VCBS repeat-containing protein [Myxococcales bacterium]
MKNFHTTRIGLVLAAVSFLACGSDTSETDPCRDVACADGETCSEGVCLCGGADGSVCESGYSCLASAGACYPEGSLDSCAEGTSYSQGEAFRDVSEDWGIPSMGIVATLVTVVDYDRDGWPDLMLRRGGNTVFDDFQEGGTRIKWLLRNNGQGGFEDVTESSELFTPRSSSSEGMGRPGGLVVFGDVDNDGFPDAYTGVTTQDETAAAGERSEIML